MHVRLAPTRVLQAALAAAVLLAVMVVMAPRAHACACGPYAPPLASAGVGNQPQTVAITLYDGETAAMYDPDFNEVDVWTDPGIGTYTFDEVAATITFTPVLGYVGTPEPDHLVWYMLTDEYDHTDFNNYTPVVLRPAVPAAPAVSSTGPQGAVQSAMLTVPEGGSVALLDGSGSPVDTVTVAGQGSYVLDPTTGEVRFSPLAAFTGDASPVGYRVSDAYDQSTDGTLVLHVLAAQVDPVVTTTTTTTTPTTTRAPAPAAGTLPQTGSTSGPLAAGAVLLITGGVALLAIRRRSAS